MPLPAAPDSHILAASTAWAATPAIIRAEAMSARPTAVGDDAAQHAAGADHRQAHAGAVDGGLGALVGGQLLGRRSPATRTNTSPSSDSV